VTKYLSRLLWYDVWANRETLQAMPEQGSPPKSLNWLGHIIAAEYLWLARLAREPAPMPVWPSLSLEDCAEQLNQLSPELLTISEHLTPGRLGENVTYTNSKGERWSSTVEEILTHLVIHSAYHRGQIAADLRVAGHTPPYTDYIHAVRQGLIG
jgi:uncharacterized damage-inducible protein DinB